MSTINQDAILEELKDHFSELFNNEYSQFVQGKFANIMKSFHNMLQKTCKQVQELEKDNKLLKKNQENLERHQRLNSLIFTGPDIKIKKKCNSSEINDTIIKAYKKNYNLTITKSSISSCRPIFRKNEHYSNRAIIKFTTQIEKDRLLSQSISKRNNREPTTLYIGEHLSTLQSELHFNVRHIKREHPDKFYTIYTKNGVTTYKRSADSVPVSLKTMQDLDDLIDEIYPELKEDSSDEEQMCHEDEMPQ